MFCISPVINEADEAELFLSISTDFVKIVSAFSTSVTIWSKMEWISYEKWLLSSSDNWVEQDVFVEHKSTAPETFDDKGCLLTGLVFSIVVV